MLHEVGPFVLGERAWEGPCFYVKTPPPYACKHDATPSGSAPASAVFGLDTVIDICTCGLCSLLGVLSCRVELATIWNKMVVGQSTYLE